MRKLYLFDCFGVVVSEVSLQWMNRHFDEEQKDYIRRNFFRKVDTAAISQDELYTQLADHYGMNRQAIIDEWDELICVNQDTLNVIGKIRQRGDVVALLSNASVEFINYIFTKFDLYKYFDKIFVSAQYKYAKPDREFYQICLNSFTEKFEKIYFTDDNPVNLKNLEELGITPVLFTTAAQFEKEIS